MKAKITRYLIPLLILTIIITFCSFSCSTPGPAAQKIEESAQKTVEEITVEEPEEEPSGEVAESEKKEKINSTLEEGNNLYQEKEYDKSLDKFNEVLNLDSSNKEAKERIKEIEGILTEVEIIIANGDKLFNQGKYQEALNKYKDAEDLYPSNEEISKKVLQAQSKLDEEILLANEKKSSEEDQVSVEKENEITEENKFRLEMKNIYRPINSSLIDFEKIILDSWSPNSSTDVFECQKAAKKLIEEIEPCYKQFIGLSDPPKKLETANNLFGNAMYHFYNSSTYLKKFIEINDKRLILLYTNSYLLERIQGSRYIEELITELRRLYPEDYKNIEFKEEKKTEEEIKKEKLYLEEWASSLYTINDDITYMLTYFQEDTTDFANGVISTSSYKKYVKGYINEIDYIFKDYINLYPPKNYYELHIAYGEVIEHLIIMSTYLAKFVSTNKEDEMIYWINKSSNETNLIIEAFKKATEELKKFSE